MKLPKSIQALRAKHPDKIDDAFTERDYGGDNISGWSIWVYLKRGWINTATETHSIHEDNVREVMKMWKMVKPCECNDCKSGFIAA